MSASMSVAGRPIDPVEATLRALAARGLGGSPATLPQGGRAPLDELVRRAVDHRLVGVLAAAVRAGELPASSSEAAAVHAAHGTALAWCLRVERAMLEVVDRLRSLGIEPVVLKGPAAAHLDAPDPSERTFADLDLLVRGDDLPAAVQALQADGATRPAAERRPGFDRRFAKSVTLTRPDGVEVDLHRSLADGRFGHRIALADLHRHRQRFEVAGTTLSCLAPVHRVAHAAYHAVLGSPQPRLASQRDLLGLLALPSLPCDVVVPAVDRWGGRAVLWVAVDELERTVGACPPAWRAWRLASAPSPAELEAVARDRREGSNLGRAKWQVLSAIPSWRDRMAYLHALVVPSTEHLASRGQRRWQRWWRPGSKG